MNIDNILLGYQDELTGFPPSRLQRTKLLRVIRDICERTWFWTETIEDMPLQENVTSYPLIPQAADTEIIGIDSVKTDGVPMNENSYSLELSHYLVLKDAPSASGQTVDVTVALRPERDATTIPDEIHNEIDDILREGFLAQMKRMRGKPWYDPDAAVDHYAQYMEGIYKMRLQVEKGGTSRDLKAKIISSYP